MRLILGVLIGFVIVGIAAAVFIIFTKKPLHAALTSSMALLGSVVTSAISPGSEGEADIVLILPFAHITAKYLRINPHEPLQQWYAILSTVLLVTLVALTFVFLREPPTQR